MNSSAGPSIAAPAVLLNEAAVICLFGSALMGLAPT